MSTAGCLLYCCVAPSLGSDVCIGCLHGQAFGAGAERVHLYLCVQARGTNHLDFFRFVGRVVGKALHDGQTIDAYFTRSFYKHCLGQPLTYQARMPACALSSTMDSCLFWAWHC